MDREELNDVIRRGPVRITMNSGDTVDILNLEMALIGSVTAAVLVKGQDGKFRQHLYPLVTMSKVEHLQPASQ